MAKPIALSKYRKFLKAIGLKHIRTESSHEIWDNPDHPLLRPVTVDSKYKDVPLMHIHTTLKNLNMSKADFESKIKDL